MLRVPSFPCAEVAHAFRATCELIPAVESLQTGARREGERPPRSAPPGAVHYPVASTSPIPRVVAGEPARRRFGSGSASLHWCLATAHSSSGLGHRPLTAAARVRIPY